MNFDVKSYCRRMADSGHERFRLHEFDDDEDCCGWTLVDNNKYNTVSEGESSATLWAFIGPLADELNVKWFDLFESLGKAEYPGVSNTLLEATFAAVCEKLEAAKEEAV